MKLEIGVDDSRQALWMGEFSQNFNSNRVRASKDRMPTGRPWANWLSDYNDFYQARDREKSDNRWWINFLMLSDFNS